MAAQSESKFKKFPYEIVDFDKSRGLKCLSAHREEVLFYIHLKEVLLILWKLEM